MGRIQEIDAKLKEYKTVIDAVNLLKKEKATLVKKEKAAKFKKLSFEEKFAKWLFSDKGEEESYIPDNASFRSMLDKYHLNRYQTYDISDEFTEEFICVYDLKRRKKCIDEGVYTQEQIDTFIEAAKYLYKENIIKFKYDW